MAVTSRTVKEASGGWWTLRIPSGKGKKGRAYMAGMGVIPGEVLFAPARAVQVRYGDGMIIRAGGGEEAIRIPFGPVSVEED